MNSEVVVLFIDRLERTPAAERIEPALAGTRGVQSVSMNFATDKVRVTYDPELADLRRLVEAVRSTGCDVRALHAIIDVEHIESPSCAARIEQALRAVGGVLHASVDLPTRRAIVSYLPGYLTMRDLGQVIREAGYQPTRELTTASLEPTHLGRVGARAH